MKTLIIFLILLFYSCFQEPTLADGSTSEDDWEIVIVQPTLRYTYRFYKDSLFSELVPLADGSYPGNSIITDYSDHPKYNREDIPDPAWVIRMDLQEGSVGEWKLVGDSLVGDDGVVVGVEWELVNTTPHL